MAIRIQCESCESRISAPERTAGKKVKCPKCGATISVPPKENAEETAEGDFRLDAGSESDSRPMFAPPGAALTPKSRPAISEPELPPLPAPRPRAPAGPALSLPDPPSSAASAPKAGAPAPAPAPAPRPPAAPAHAQARCLIIGPQRCGKTSLLSTLMHAAGQVQPGKTQYNVQPQVGRTLDFFVALADAILRTGRIDFPGTIGMIEHRFALEQVTQGWFGVNRARYEFHMVDTAGATVLPQPGEAATVDETKRGEILAAARASESLILLVDAADQKATGTFFVSLLPFLANAAEGGYLNFKRVAIVLTKADVLVVHHGVNAKDQLEKRLDPWDHAINASIGRSPLRQLLLYLRPEYRSAVRCGWASVYGFIPQCNDVNVVADDEEGDRLAVFNPHDPSWVNRWQPYQVLDPFVYTATGHSMGLKVMPPDLARGL